jgi:uncharacterized membrane protein YgcG
MRCKRGKRSYTCAMPKIKCPACAASLDAPAEVCPQCKFTLRRLDPKFGTLPLRNRYLTDRAQSLTVDEVGRLRELLARFEIKFPQSLFSVFVTELPADSNVREYAFWLSNRAIFSSVEAEGVENFDLLLVIDPTHRSAALTVGYGLENFVTEDDLKDVLEAAEPALRGDQLERAIRTCIGEMTRRLCDLSKAAARERIERLNAEEW